MHFLHNSICNQEIDFKTESQIISKKVIVLPQEVKAKDCGISK